MINEIFPEYLKIGCYYIEINIIDESIDNREDKIIYKKSFGNFKPAENEINIRRLYKLSDDYKRIYTNIGSMTFVLLHEILHVFDYFFNFSLFNEDEFLIDEMSKHFDILFTFNTNILEQFSKDLFYKENNIFNIFPIEFEYIDEIICRIGIVYDFTSKENKIRIDDYILPYFKIPNSFNNPTYKIKSNILELITFQFVNISNSIIYCDNNIDFEKITELSKMLYLFLIDNPEFINMYKKAIGDF